MKLSVLFSILVLTVSSAKAADATVGTSIAPTFTTACEGGRGCRVIVEAADEAKSFLVNENSEIGPRLQKAMAQVQAQYPDVPMTNQELAQVIWQQAQELSKGAQ